MDGLENIHYFMLKKCVHLDLMELIVSLDIDIEMEHWLIDSVKWINELSNDLDMIDRLTVTDWLS